MQFSKNCVVLGRADNVAWPGMELWEPSDSLLVGQAIRVAFVRVLHPAIVSSVSTISPEVVCSMLFCASQWSLASRWCLAQVLMFVPPGYHLSWTARMEIWHQKGCKWEGKALRKFDMHSTRKPFLGENRRFMPHVCSVNKLGTVERC